MVFYGCFLKIAFMEYIFPRQFLANIFLILLIDLSQEKE